MTADEILKQLAKMGNDGYKKLMLKHGAKEPYFGVKIEDMKDKFQKKIKKDYQLALDLFDSGNGDAQYLAGLIADEGRMTKADLQRWAKNASWKMISEYSVAWVAGESRFGFELGKEWIDSDDENVATTGWATLSSLVSVKPDGELPIKELDKLLGRVAKSIAKSPDRVRYSMNSFVIAVGAYVSTLTDKAVAAAKQIGKVTVDMGDTACRVPDAAEYIAKVAKAGRIGRKRKTARC
jgi:3-methyladenine DNA glycosylase AlkD